MYFDVVSRIYQLKAIEIRSAPNKIDLVRNNYPTKAMTLFLSVIFSAFRYENVVPNQIFFFKQGALAALSMFLGAVTRI